MMGPGSTDASGTRKPRLLYLTRTYPYLPATGGDMVYSAGVIESLGQAADVTVLAASNGAVEPGSFDAHGVHWRIVPRARAASARSLASAMPNIVWRGATPAYRATLDRLLREAWDGVVLDHLGSAHALAAIDGQRRAGRRLPVLYLSHEFEAEARAEKYRAYGGGALRQAALRVDGAKVARWEQRVVAASDAISVINPSEAALYARQAPDKRFITTTPGYAGPRVAARVIDASVPRRIALLGGRGSQQKQQVLLRWLAESAAIIAAAGVEMEVIGALDAGLRDDIAQRFPDVTIRGYVDDLVAHLQTCRLGVIPDFVGRGVKLRLLDLVFARVPLAGLDGAIDGLPLAADRDFAEAPTLPELARLAVALVDDLSRLNAFQESAFAACDGAFDWRDRGRAIVDLFATINARSG